MEEHERLQRQADRHRLAYRNTKDSEQLRQADIFEAEATAAKQRFETERVAELKAEAIQREIDRKAAEANAIIEEGRRRAEAARTQEMIRRGDEALRRAMEEQRQRDRHERDRIKDERDRRKDDPHGR